MRSTLILVIFAVACDRTVGRFAAATAADAPTYTLSITSVSPPLVHAGDTVSIAATASDPLNGCGVVIAGQNGNCTSSGAHCACTFAVSTATPEGALSVVVAGTIGNAAPQATATLQVDQQGPLIDQSKVSIERAAMGTPDDVLIGAGGITEPQPSYATQAITALRVWTQASGGTSLDVASPDLSQALRVNVGTSTQAPPQVWLSAVDAVGNESARAAITNGSDEAAPVVDGTQLSLTILPALVADSLSGAASAVSDTQSAIASVQILAEPTDTMPLSAAFVPNTNGSFAATSPLTA